MGRRLLRRREQQSSRPGSRWRSFNGAVAVGDGEAAEEIERRARNIASMGPSPVGDGELPACKSNAQTTLASMGRRLLATESTTQ